MTKRAWLKRKWNKGLRRKDPNAGVYFSGRGQGLIDKKLYETYFNDWREGSCLECGALDGQSLSICKFFEDRLHWKRYNIEGNPTIFPTLLKNCPTSVNIPYILSNGEQEVVYFVGNKKYAKLSKVLPVEKGENLIKEYPEKIFRIPCITYKEFVILCGITKLDLFVLDVEGHEFEVLDGMEGATVFPEIMCIEEHKELDRLKERMSRFNYNFEFTSGYNHIFKIRGNETKAASVVKLANTQGSEPCAGNGIVGSNPSGGTT